MKFLLFFILVSSIAFAQDLRCTGIDNINVLVFKNHKLEIYKTIFKQTPTGELISLKEIGAPSEVDTNQSGGKTFYRGIDFEFVAKNGRGLITFSDNPEISSKEYFCEDYVETSGCMPGDCP